MKKIMHEGRELLLYLLLRVHAIVAELITTLSMATFLGCMHRAFVYAGGVPREVVFDNAKTVAAERVGTVIRYNEDLLRMAVAYEFQPKACWINDPESKARSSRLSSMLGGGFATAVPLMGWLILTLKPCGGATTLPTARFTAPRVRFLSNA
jgi:hypothetical protein